MVLLMHFFFSLYNMTLLRRVQNKLLVFFQAKPMTFKTCKPSVCRPACAEASAGRFPAAVRPAADGNSDRHPAGPAVGHVRREAKCHEGSCYRRPQGTVTSVNHCSLTLYFRYSLINTQPLIVFRQVAEPETLLRVLNILILTLMHFDASALHKRSCTQTAAATYFLFNQLLAHLQSVSC